MTVLSLAYLPFEEEDVNSCVAEFERLMKEVHYEWERESKKYEETIPNPMHHPNDKAVKQPPPTTAADPTLPPKRAISAYHFFTAAYRNKVQARTTRDRGALLAAAWESLAPDEKAQFEAMGAQDKARYDDEMARFSAQDSKTKRRKQDFDDDDDDDSSIPRRNYANPTGTIQDESLFPYHDSCYALLDCYDSLYMSNENGMEEMIEQPIPKNSITPSASAHPVHGWVEPPRIEPDGGGFDPDNSDHDEDDDTIFLLSTGQSIMAVLFQRQKDPRKFEVDDEIPLHITGALIQSILQVSQAPKFVGHNADDLHKRYAGLWESWNVNLKAEECSPTATPLPADPKQRQTLLLKILKHSLSELQRDHLLASAVLTRLAMDGSLQDVQVLRRTLIILASEYVVYSDFDWDDEQKDDLRLWKYFLEILHYVLTCATGEFLTKDIALTLASFARFAYLREFGHLVNTTTATATLSSNNQNDNEATAGTNNNHSNRGEASSSRVLSQEQMRLHLKRSLVASRMEEQDDLEDTAPNNPQTQTPARILLCIVQSLGKRGERELERLATTDWKDSSIDEAQLASSLDSYYNCLVALVSIAESSIEILPTSERFFQLASILVRSITASLVHIPAAASLENRSLMANQGFYFVGEPHFGQLESFVLSPFRLADRIRNATKYAREQRLHQNFIPFYVQQERITTTSGKRVGSDGVLLALHNVLHGRPPSMVQTAVRGLFARDGVYLTMSGMGYGDFVVWCRFAIDPSDPLLHHYEFNHILPDDIESDDDSDDEEEDDWGVMWNEPIEWAENENGCLKTGELWCHFNFQLMAMRVAWEEPWNPESHFSFSSRFQNAARIIALCLGRHQIPGPVVETIISYLPRQAWPEDRQYKDFHKRVSIEPPYSGSDKEHAAFCQSIADGSYKNPHQQEPSQSLDCMTTADDNFENGEDDDEGSWSSIDSEEERAMANLEPESKTVTITQAITNYMRQHKIRPPVSY